MNHTTASVPKKVLASLTAVGVLTLGGMSAAHAAHAADAPAGTDTTRSATGFRAEHPHRFRIALKTAFTAAADTLGLTTDELRAAVKSGPQSIATVAGDRTAAVTDAVVAAWSNALDTAVANGRISAERADRVRARLPELAQRFVSWVPGTRAGAGG